MKWIDDIRDDVKGKTHIPKDWLLKQLDIIKSRTIHEFKDKIQYYNSTKILKPDNINRYDIVYAGIGGIPHPVLIFKTKGEYCYGIIISSTDGSHCLTKIEGSRYFKDACATITMIKEKEEVLLDKWIGVFDNKKEADRIIKAFKTHITEVL